MDDDDGDIVGRALANKRKRDDEEALIRWDLRVPPDLDDAAKHRAVKENVTRTHLVVAILRETLMGGR